MGWWLSGAWYDDGPVDDDGRTLVWCILLVPSHSGLYSDSDCSRCAGGSLDEYRRSEQGSNWVHSCAGRIDNRSPNDVRIYVRLTADAHWRYIGIDLATSGYESGWRGLKDATIAIVALVVTGLFASALIIPQLIVSPPVNAGSSYYQNRNSGMSGGMGKMMQGGMMGSMPMMNGMMGYYSEVPTPLSHDDARASVSKYLASLNSPDLRVNEFEEYSHNFYVSLVEKSSGKGAIEIIIDRYSRSLQPEPQSMMWNTRYGMMGSSQGVEMIVTSEQATRIAQDFLDIVFPGTRVGEIVAYYGYYTIMTTLEGEHYGMLSVNGYSGEVWYHTWHGMFLSDVRE